MKYLVQSAVKEYCKCHGRRVGKDFMAALEGHIEDKLGVACRMHNAGKKTLDRFVAEYIGLIKKRRK